MRIAIGSDHRGYLVKEKLIRVLEQLGHDVEDNGTHDSRSVDYPDIASAVSRKVAGGIADRGILICGTGIGMCIAANKIAGVRAAPCHDELTAEIIRRHNDANVLCLSADMLGGREFDRMVEVWLDTPFDGGRHLRRLKKIAELEHSDLSSGVLAETLNDRPADCGG
jgi:ribose 5-phosphate isomerase B